MQCVTWLLLFAGAVFVMVSLLRWFEQTADAVERREWDKVTLLVAVPFAVWFYPSKVTAGRPTAVPLHEPVKGFGGLGKERSGGRGGSEGKPAKQPLAGLTDEPPPGTPKEFLGMPVVPPRNSRPARPPVDPDKMAKLKRKMREQGMLEDQNESDALDH